MSSLHADASRSNTYIVPELVFGVTPVSPTMQYLAVTGNSIKLTKETFESGVLHGDRMTRDHRHGAKQVAGDFSLELTAGVTTDMLLEALLGGTWVADELKVGGVRRSFTILRHFTDLDAADKPFHYYRGITLNDVSFGFQPNGMITATVSVVGKDANYETAALAGQTLLEPTEEVAIDGFSGSLFEGGNALATVSEAQISVANGIETRFVLGEDTTQEVSVGMATVTGSLTSFFHNSDLIEKFVNETESELAINVADPDANDYTFSVPRMVYNNADYDESGPGAIMVSMGFKGIREGSEDSNIIITRIADY